MLLLLKNEAWEVNRPEEIQEATFQLQFGSVTQLGVPSGYLDWYHFRQHLGM